MSVFVSLYFSLSLSLSLSTHTHTYIHTHTHTHTHTHLAYLWLNLRTEDSLPSLKFMVIFLSQARKNRNNTLIGSRSLPSKSFRIGHKSKEHCCLYPRNNTKADILTVIFEMRLFVAEISSSNNFLINQ